MKPFVVIVALVCLLALPALGQWTPFGSYSQTTTYVTSVQPPINADGTSVFAAKRGVIPVKFSLATALGDLTIASSAKYPDPNSYGGVYTVPGTLTLDNLTTLQFNGTINGSCGGGSPRFQINYGSQNIFVYLGAAPNFNDANCAAAGANHNFMDNTDLRFDTSQIGGGNFYDTLDHARTLMAGVPIQEIDFVVDGFWSAGPQSITLVSMTVNSNTFTFATTPNPTCTLPPATIALLGPLGSANLLPVDEAVYAMPSDNGNNFRIDGCHYIYNLNAKQLAGSYRVFANVDGTVVQTNPGSFALK